MRVVENQKGIIPLVVIIIVIMLLAGVGGICYWQKQQISSTLLIPQATESTTSNQPTPSQMNGTNLAGWQTYTNTKYQFSLQYPPNWQIRFTDTSGQIVPQLLLKPTNSTDDLYIFPVGIHAPSIFDVSSPKFPITPISIGGRKGRQAISKFGFGTVKDVRIDDLNGLRLWSGNNKITYGVSATESALMTTFDTIESTIRFN